MDFRGIFGYLKVVAYSVSPNSALVLVADTEVH